MKKDFLEITKSLMVMNAYPSTIAQSIRVLKEKWPNLTDEEKMEIDAVVEALRSIANCEDLETNSLDEKTK